jgi:hypothetical protein
LRPGQSTAKGAKSRHCPGRCRLILASFSR